MLSPSFWPWVREPPEKFQMTSLGQRKCRFALSQQGSYPYHDWVLKTNLGLGSLWCWTEFGGDPQNMAVWKRYVFSTIQAFSNSEPPASVYRVALFCVLGNNILKKCSLLLAGGQIFWCTGEFSCIDLSRAHFRGRKSCLAPSLRFTCNCSRVKGSGSDWSLPVNAGCGRPMSACCCC